MLTLAWTDVAAALPDDDALVLVALNDDDVWPAFRSAMTQMRRIGHAVTHAEVDPDRIGISVPVLDEARRVLGSLSYVIAAREERAIARLVSLASTGAREIREGMQVAPGSTKAAAA